MTTITSDFLEGERFQRQLENIIRNGDPNTLTTKLIRKQLESHFNLDADSLKPFKDTLNEKISEVFEAIDGESSKEETELKIANTKKRKVPPTEEADSTTQHKPESKKKLKKVPKESASEEEEDMDETIESEEEGDDDTFSQSSKSTPRKAKKKTEPIQARPAGSSKDEETIKRLKQFINKCGVRKVWSRELADCKSASAEIRKLKAILTDLGVTGRPSNEKCEAIKRERELRAEVDGLDTSLIIDKVANERGLRLRNRSQNRPSYKIDDPSDESEEEEEEDDKEGTKKNSKKKTDSEDEEVEEDDEEEEEEDDESSEDEFHDSSDEE